MSALCWCEARRLEAWRLKARSGTYPLSIQAKVYVTVGLDFHGTNKFIFAWIEDAALPFSCG